MSTRRAKTITASALSRTRWGKAAKHRASLAGDAAMGAAAHDLLIEIAVADKVGSPRYATRAHELVQLLYDQGVFLQVEADIPVPTFDSSRMSRPARATSIFHDQPCSDNIKAAPRDWVLKELRVPEALALLPPANANGKGIRIGHPDSGYSSHFALGLDRLDRQNDRDVISSDDDAVDPLHPPKSTFFHPLPNPGHGTSTASVMVGHGEQAFVGIAQAAEVVPIRATESVVQVFDTDVAKAVRWARAVNCHVVSMSLGGKGLFGLHDAIQEAVNDGMIVMAAAGNDVHFVTAPASYDNCLAVAATGPDAKPWTGSSRGSAVDACAPGACIWTAAFVWGPSPPGQKVAQSNGTSYAVAHLAAVAALWLSRHGRDSLIQTYGKANIQKLFVFLLHQPGVCRKPAGWDGANWGAGVIDAKALLEAPLPQPFQLGGLRAVVRGAADQPLERIASNVSATIPVVANWVDQLLGSGASQDHGLLRRFEGELVYHLATNAEFAVTMRSKSAVSSRSRAKISRSLPGASPQLQKLIQR
jgi:hypothetical protein